MGGESGSDGKWSYMSVSDHSSNTVHCGWWEGCIYRDGSIDLYDNYD